MAGQRVTPVEAAKELGIRPQMVYGFIKHGRIKTYSNPGGKTDHVDLKEVEAVAKGVKHHVPKDASGKPVRRRAPVTRGTLISSHAHFPGERRDRPHRVLAVREVGNQGGELDGSYVWTMDADGAPRLMYEEDALAQMLLKKQCHIESPEALLGVLAFHWEAQDRRDLAGSIRMWAEVNGIVLTELVEA
jgi:hypothetical protein